MATKKPAGENGALPKLKALYEFMTANNLETLEIEEQGFRVKLARRGADPAPVPVPTALVGLPAAAPLGAAPAVSAPAPSFGPPAGASAVKSTMMGIFYRAASPSSPPFVKEGDAVKSGQVLCMIEAMKVFNEIKADFSGIVAKILVENGKPVKSGQELFYIQRT